ncbi:MAG: aminoglycoside phosphotransferase family protein [Gammaproteobacteria bacterium]
MFTDINKKLLPFLKTAGIADDSSRIRLTPLSGGVSSDIYRLDIDADSYCLKQALPKLKVDIDWYADTNRSYYEFEWLHFAHSINNNNTPKLIAYERETGFILMEYLPPECYPVWKKQLLDGAVDPGFAARVGMETARIHAHAHDNPYIKDLFQTGAMFHQLRIEPYLLYTGQRYEDLRIRKAFMTLADSLRETHITLIHGDVSPKNILVGPGGPVFLDAECAFYGDPAFDLSFCLNHLLLKSIRKAELYGKYTDAYKNLVAAYLKHVTWEDRDLFVSRCLKLLPALMLARIDGKSPVEYITLEKQKQLIRRFCTTRLYESSLDLFKFSDDLGSEIPLLLQ